MKKVFLCLLAIFTLWCISTPFSYAQEAPSNSSETIATLLPWEEFNAKIKSITKGDNIPRYNASTTYDNLIKSIKKSKNKKEWLTNENLISKAWSIEIRAWYDNTNNLWILYYYTNADKIFLNENSRNMFSSMKELTDISVLSGWDTSNVTNMVAMFSNCNKLTDITALSNWDTNNVKDMSSMFRDCKSLADITALSGRNTSNVESIGGMFLGCESLIEIDLSNWDTKNVTNMREMFSSCWNLTKVNLNNWDTSNVEDMTKMFRDCNKLTDISTLSGWNTSNVKDMYQMFLGCESLADITALSGWNTSNVKNMNYMFWWCDSLTEINLSNWDLSNAQDVDYMFAECENLAKIDLRNWDLSNIKSIKRMFRDCSKLTDISTLSGWDTSNIENMWGLFDWCESLTDISALSGWNTSKVEDIGNMFEWCSSLTDISALSNWNTSNVTGMTEIFRWCSSLTGISPLSNWDTSNVTSMYEMFEWCSSLTDISALSNWNTSNVTSMEEIFKWCSSLTGISPLSNWNTSNVTDMSYMFYGCNSLTDISALSSWDTSNIESIGDMFDWCSSLTWIDLTNWDTSNVTNMWWMFNWCNNLEKIYVSNKFTIKNVTYSNFMFHWCTKLVWWNGTKYNDQHRDAEYARIDTAETPGYFTAITNEATNWCIGMDQANVTATATQWVITLKWNAISWDTVQISLFDPNDEVFKNLWSVNMASGEFNYTMQWDWVHNFVLNNWCKEFYYQFNNTSTGTNKCDVNWDWQIGIGDQVRYTNNCVGYTTIVPWKEKCDVNWDWQIGVGDQVALGNCITWTGSNSWNSGWNSNSQNSTTKKEEPKSQWYSWGGWWRSSSTKVSKWNSTTKADNNKKTSTENGRTTTTPTNAKWNTNITTNKKQPIDYMVPTINKVKHNEWNSSEVLENWFTRERNNAYGFAYANWITTIKNIEKANLNWAITRAAMAKMLSNYAINVLGKEPDTSKAPHFWDISKETDKQYDNWITLAYQLWIMWVWTKNFRPYDPVTRKEFVTVLSRMLYNTTDWASKTNYYEPHMAKLYDEWIITKTNPATIEKRWNVMTMLMRSAK